MTVIDALKWLVLGTEPVEMTRLWDKIHDLIGTLDERTSTLGRAQSTNTSMVQTIQQLDKDKARLRDDLMKKVSRIGALEAYGDQQQRTIAAQSAELQSLRGWQRMEIAQADAVSNGWIAQANAQVIEVLRVRGTLAFYADETNYLQPIQVTSDAAPAPVLIDAGQKARDALADFLA